MDKLAILLADDHAIMREGLAMLIDREDDMTVVAQAANGREAVDLARSLIPDVAVLDISMPDMGGAEATHQIRTQCPQVRVVALTRHSDQAYLRRMLQLGASGYVLKKHAAEGLIAAIRAVARGETYIEPELTTALLHRAFVVRPEADGEGERNADALSAREEQVLREVAWGRSSKEIATQLGLSTKTVESYKASATDKLALHTRPEIVRYAVARGWLSQDNSPD